MKYVRKYGVGLDYSFVYLFIFVDSFSYYLWNIFCMFYIVFGDGKVFVFNCII